MTNEAREARNAYKREWSRKNRDKVHKYYEDYWEKKAKELKGESENENNQNQD